MRAVTFYTKLTRVRRVRSSSVYGVMCTDALPYAERLLQAVGECGLNIARMALSLVSRNGKDEVNLQLSSWCPAKGDTLAILVTVPPATALFEKFSLSIRENIWKESFVNVSFDGNHVPAFPMACNSSVWRALAPTTPLDDPGPRLLVVEIKDGRHKLFDGSVDIRDKYYPCESIWLSDAKSNLHGTKKEMKAVTSLRLTSSSVQFWKGPWCLPVQGEVTTDFGLQRFYNGIFADGYYHQGVDYGAEEGTPVKAPANGRVILIGRELDGFKLHGNCVGLDHGHGVTSILMHLSKITVEEGTIVEIGDVVGSVGETGLATGPHLHWGLHVNGKAVDPTPWMQQQSWL